MLLVEFGGQTQRRQPQLYPGRPFANDTCKGCDLAQQRDADGVPSREWRCAWNGFLTDGRRQIGCGC